MDPKEYEFVAENEKVMITPKFNHGTMTLIQGDVGPFISGLPLEVPVWLGVMMRQQGRCNIDTPEWMELERLEECRDEEKESPVFTKLPAKHIFEIANMLLDVTTETIKNADQVRSVLRDIWDIRQSKLRRSVDAFIQGEYLHAKINHMEAIELSTVRPVLPQAFDHIHRLKEAEGAAARRAALSLSNSTPNSTRN